MKKWFLERFLPLWAKEAVLAENRALQEENRRLRQAVSEREAYIRGLEAGLRGVRRIVINKEAGSKVN